MPPEQASEDWTWIGEAVEDWPGWFAESVAAFRDVVAALPEGERPEALRAGRDALDAVGARLVGAKAAKAGDSGALSIGGAPLGA